MYNAEQSRSVTMSGYSTMVREQQIEIDLTSLDISEDVDTIRVVLRAGRFQRSVVVGQHVLRAAARDAS